MKLLTWIGVVLVILGIAAFLFPVPHYEDHSLNAGDVKIGVQTRSDEKLPPAAGIVAIVGGVALMIAASRQK